MGKFLSVNENGEKESLIKRLHWNEAPNGGIPTKELTSYALGLMGQNHLWNMTANWFFPFCTNVLHMDPATVGKMTGASTVLDALNDPVIGAYIDNHRFKNGEKLRPWLVWTSPLAGLAGMLIFINWGFPSQWMTVAYSMLFFLLWDIMFSFQDTAIWGMLGAIHPRSEERDRANQWGYVGGFAGGLLPSLLLPMLGETPPFGLTHQSLYLIFAVVLCFGGSLQAMLAGRVKERVKTPLKKEEKVSFWQKATVVRHNKIFIVLMAASLLSATAPSVQDLYVFQQVNYTVMGRQLQGVQALYILGALTGLPGTLSMLFANKLAKKIGGMKNVIVIAKIADIICRLLSFAVGYKSFGRLALGAAIGMISSVPCNMVMIATRSLMADSIDYVEYKTGERTEAMTFSLSNFLGKFSSAMQKLIQGYTLTFLQYDSAKLAAGVPQNARFNKFIWPVYKLGPAIGGLLYLVPFLFLHYTKEDKKKVEAELERRRAEAAADAAVQTEAEV